jgi:outer membrane murein-binding lipoprotein Lpp
MIKLLILLLLLAGCSNSNSMDKIDISSQIISCKVFQDHIECMLDDGNIYYAMRSKVDAVTQWDKSTWAVQ